MAESRVSGPKGANVPCRYFAKGICSAGDTCTFLHQSGMNSSNDNSSRRTSRTETQKHVCTYFQQGNCKFGSSCMFRHQPASATSSSGLSENSGSLSSSQSSSVSSKSNITPSSSSRSRSTTSLSSSKPTIRPSSNIKGTTGGQNQKNAGTKSKREASNSSQASTSISSSDCDSDNSKENMSPVQEERSVPDSRLNFDAPEFVPSYLLPTNSVETEKTSGVKATGGTTKTWAQIVSPEGSSAMSSEPQFNPNAVPPLCPYAEMGDCPFSDDCQYLHGDICEFCGLACLHPFSEEISKQHTSECIKQHEIDMEHSMAVARSRDKVCGVCFEIIMEKRPIWEQRFGILPNCNHCFCLACIRKWRQAKQFESKIIRACPECRVTSDFVCPSTYWVDTKEDKDKLFTEYKQALSLKQCKYFQQGKGKCPFGNKCFYLHAYPDGTKVDLGPPVRRRWQDANGDIIIVDEHLLWDYVFDREEGRWLDDFDDDSLEELLLDTFILSGLFD